MNVLSSRRFLPLVVLLALTAASLPSSVAHASVAERHRVIMNAMAEHGPRTESARPQHVDPDKDCLDDPAGDTTDDRADVVWWCTYLGDDEIRVAMALADTTSPETHPSWDGFTAAGWTFDTSGNREAEYTVLLMRVDGAVLFAMLDEDANLVCEAEGYEADGVIYQASFDADCLGGADSAEVVALMVFDSAPASPGEDLHLDFAPDSGPATVHRHSHGSTGPSPTPTRAPAPAPVPAGALRATGRLAGPDRMSTAVAISQRAFPDGAAVVYLARQDLNPDALVAGALSDGPVLLVPSCGALPAVVADEIRRLGAREVFALGGPGSVCQEILDAAAVA